MTTRTRTLISTDRKVGVTIDPDGTVTVATRESESDMWSAPVDLRDTDGATLTDAARCDLVEWAWYEVAKGELMLTDDDGTVDREQANVVLNMWDEVEQFTTMFDVEQTDLEHDPDGRDRGVALRVANALAVLWYGSDHWGSTGVGMSDDERSVVVAALDHHLEVAESDDMSTDDTDPAWNPATIRGIRDRVARTERRS